MEFAKRSVYKRPAGRSVRLPDAEATPELAAELWRTPQSEAILITEECRQAGCAAAWAEHYGLPLHVVGTLFEDFSRPRMYEDGEMVMVAVIDPLDPAFEMLVVTKPHALLCLSNKVPSWWDEFLLRWGRGNYAPPLAGPRALYSLLDEVVDAVFPVLDALQDRVDDLGDVIIAGGTVKQAAVLDEMRNLIALRRQIVPLRDELNSLLRRDEGCIPLELHDDFGDVYRHAHRILESIELSRDFLSSLISTQLNTASLKLNEVMKVLTISATVLMSVTLIASIYGMNFKYMPELNHPLGYPGAILAMLLVAGGLIVTFRRSGWL